MFEYYSHLSGSAVSRESALSMAKIAPGLYSSVSCTKTQRATFTQRLASFRATKLQTAPKTVRLNIPRRR